MIRKIAKPRALALSAGLILASVGTAAADVTIMNCTNTAAVQVATYNSNDAVRLIAYKDACIRGRGKSATLSCATKTCFVKVWAQCPGVTEHTSNSAISGSWFYYNGQLYSMSAVVKSATDAKLVPAGTKTLSCDQIEKLPKTYR